MAAKPEKVVVDLCVGHVLSDVTRSYHWKDTVLYALSVGASESPLDEEDLRFTYELNSEGLQVLPSFATVLPSIQVMFDALTECPGMPTFDPMMLLHGDQTLTLHEPLKPEDTVAVKSYIRSVRDKGSGALITVASDCTRAADGTLICALTCGLFVRGLGGFSSGRGPKEGMAPLPDRPPDRSLSVRTALNQALYYRLNGDVNPLHADPAMAAIGGFDRPILHGLCTYGVACRGVLRRCCGNDPSRLKAISGRFTAPVVPGDELEVEMWVDGQASFVGFQVYNKSRQTVALAGNAQIEGPRSKL